MTCGLERRHKAQSTSDGYESFKVLPSIFICLPSHCITKRSIDFPRARSGASFSRRSSNEFNNSTNARCVPQFSALHLVCVHSLLIFCYHEKHCSNNNDDKILLAFLPVAKNKRSYVQKITQFGVWSNLKKHTSATVLKREEKISLHRTDWA
jgi:hypothetical protein